MINIFIFIISIVLVAVFASIFVFKNKKPKYNRVVKVLQEFLTYAQKEQIEGLMVLEMADKLDNFMATGKRFVAKVLSVNLAKIFSKDSVNNEGAVILRGDEIVAVNATLAGAGGHYLNSKQRIASAITSATDALAIEFSRGEIWAFMSGQRTEISPGRLVSILTFKSSKKKISIN